MPRSNRAVCSKEGVRIFFIRCPMENFPRRSLYGLPGVDVGDFDVFADQLSFWQNVFCAQQGLNWLHGLNVVGVAKALS